MKMVTLASFVAFCACPVSVAAQEACSIYNIRAGDSLSSIARDVYGTINYELIYQSNRGVIGDNPDRITVGVSLQLPCEDGSLPLEAQPRQAIASPSEGLPEPIDEVPATGVSIDEQFDPVRRLKLVTGTGYAPFTDESMPGGGVYTQLVDAAMDSVGGSVEASVTFVNDWGSHLDVLLPSQAFDGAFPWRVPNCIAGNLLGENDQFRCDEFLHSDPFYEIVQTLFVPRNSILVNAEDRAPFLENTVCLPADYSDGHLKTFGLDGSAVTLIQPETPEACLEAVVSGQAAAASMTVNVAEAAAKNLGIISEIDRVEALTTRSTLAVFVSKSHPQATEIIATLNEGLARIRLDGTWFRIVSKGFSEFYAAK
ncbi:MAG: transporter substrate-binding domain-containing protein [Pseudomonadota bacterium]